MFRHRPAEPGDLPLIASFPQSEEELFFLFPRAVFPLTAEQMAAELPHRSDATVVEWKHAVAGYANFYRWERSCCAIGNVVVAPQARGHGIGSYLIRTMIDLARNKYDAEEIQVSCFNRNTEALLLYTKLGFAPFDIEIRRRRMVDTADAAESAVALIHMRLTASGACLETR